MGGRAHTHPGEAGALYCEDVLYGCTAKVSQWVGKLTLILMRGSVVYCNGVLRVACVPWLACGGFR